MTRLPNTFITVRVQALGGKFLGDDIGGALITVRDAQTRELLATGSTAGNSGTLSSTYAPNASLSTIVTPTPGQPTIQWLLAADTDSRATTTSAFTASLVLDRPRLLEVEAYGPLGGLQSAHRVTVTEWIVPGQNLTTPPGLVMLIPGLLVQVMSPATHTQYSSAACTDREMTFQANVAMMCGCPISNAPNNPWLPGDFDVSAQVREVGGPDVQRVTLAFDPSGTPSRFTGIYSVPVNTTSNPIYYEAIITARQFSTGNVGTGTVTFFVQPSSSTPQATPSS
ncbi:MAG: hypothetical protein H7062_07885 [Candidatus Saccharimonas sp.]|nr:hypothetical protein [Planctomycetaceae bacterium]